jgi:hypothetical protein
MSIIKVRLTAFQNPKFFTEVGNIKLQTLKHSDSLIVVTNGQKSVTLLQWATGREIQSWHRTSASVKLRACFSQNNAAIITLFPAISEAKIQIYRLIEF